ncbi:uncharacterized protein LOC132305108 [Cornus florida]|uniref:uncharacterized protein LOC132305108 n=1 Tax=Cornus florida TaxID=4283 RepID=UPI00289B353F|nr:uncharacterized protein LOC132305108 [Cornus florida]
MSNIFNLLASLLKDNKLPRSNYVNRKRNLHTVLTQECPLELSPNDIQKYKEIDSSAGIVKVKGNKHDKSKGNCFHCGKGGHKKMNCLVYLAKKHSEDIFHSLVAGTCYVAGSTDTLCVDSGATKHVCNSLQGFQETRKLSDGKIYLQLASQARLGHVNLNRIQKLVKDGPLGFLVVEPFPVCKSYLEGKMTKRPFTAKGHRAKEVLELVHTVVCGPMNIRARGGYKYFITFIDDYSRYGYVYLMHRKSEAFDKFKDFQVESERQTGKSLKTLRSDRGGKYLSSGFEDHL